MINKKKQRLYTKLVILVLCLIIILRIFNLVLSKYESVTNSNANVDIAFYLLKEDYQTMTTNLEALSPKDDAYIYTFSIGNQDGEKIAETDLIYDLSIRTTTNLPLTYELYMNEEYDDIGAEDIIKTNTINQDEDGTIFRNITTNSVTLKYTEGVTNIYQLVVYFPSNYDKENYQNILELLEITVDAKQLVSQE